MQNVPMGRSIKNDMWITQEEVPNPKVLPELPGYHILVRPVSIKQATKGGILLPDSTREDMAYLTTVGQVVAVGDLAYQDKDKFPNGAWCKKDDWIIITKYAGSRLSIDGGELRIINDDEVLAVVDDPRDILPANLM